MARHKGPGAKTVTEKKPNGRPSKKIDPDAAKHVKPLVPAAVRVLKKLLKSENESVRLRAAKAILEHGMRLPEDPGKGGAAGGASGPLRVVHDPKWGA